MHGGEACTSPIHSSPSGTHIVARKGKRRGWSSGRTRLAYTSTGVRTACVNEQQNAPARAYLAYRDTSPILRRAAPVEGVRSAELNLSWMVLTAAPGLGVCSATKWRLAKG